jgi:hypothetical protein
MKTCPLCLGEISAEAGKCRHCGEWVQSDVFAFQLNSEEPFNVVMYRQMMLSVFKFTGTLVGVTVLATIVVLVCTYTCWCG